MGLTRWETRWNKSSLIEDIAYSIDKTTDTTTNHSRLFSTVANSSLSLIKELLSAVELINTLTDVQSYISPINALTYANPILLHTVEPLALAHRAYRLKDYDTALHHAKRILSTDWRKACVEWLERRITK